MKNQTIIYGASDDLIEIDGEFCEEINHYPDCPFAILISDGTLIEVEYDGEWKFRMKFKGSQFVEILQSLGEDSEEKHLNYEKVSPYSDIAVFKGKIKWVAVSEKAFY